MTDSNLEGKDLFQLTVPRHSPPSKEVRQALEAEAVEDAPYGLVPREPPQPPLL